MEASDIELSTADARNAIHEVDLAANMAEQALDETRDVTPNAAADEQVLNAVTTANVDVLRNKAKRQRMKGIENLARRHDGVASVIVNVTLNERVVASAFERFFNTIENGIHVINKSAAMFVGIKAAEQLEKTIIERIATIESRAKIELERINLTMPVHQTRDDWIVPTYSKPAAEHEVQLRTRLAKRVLGIFLMHDQFVVALNQLSWNDEADADAIEIEELAIKKELRGLATLISRTLRGMRNKVNVKEDVGGEATDAPTLATDLLQPAQLAA